MATAETNTIEQTTEQTLDKIKQQKGKGYSQFRALAAITKSSFLASFRSPEALFFGFAFPIIFIVIFGLLGGGSVNVDVAVAEGTHKDNPIYKVLDESEQITLISDKTPEQVQGDLDKGRLDGKIAIAEVVKNGIPSYEVSLTTTTASDKSGILVSVVRGVASEVNLAALKQQIPNPVEVIQLTQEEVSGREYKQIDFILPGQLAFALLSTGVFGTAFAFLNLRKTFVLKRFFATPVRRWVIVVGEAFSRLIMSILQAVVIIGFGTIFFDFTLVNGLATFAAMLLLSVLGLIVFLGLGLVVTNMANTEAAVSPIANLVTLPQFLLSGAFFDTTLLPAWLQPISNILPMSYLTGAMRKVAFEGVAISEIGTELAVLGIWIIVIYALAIKLFRWE